MEKEKSVTLFLLIIPSVREPDKACELDHSPANVKFCNACVGKLNAGAGCFVNVLHVPTELATRERKLLYFIV